MITVTKKIFSSLDMKCFFCLRIFTTVVEVCLFFRGFVSRWDTRDFVKFGMVNVRQSVVH